MTVKLVEGASLEANGQKARIRLLSEGVGSSGVYPADVLERDGATAFPAGTQLFWDHLTESEDWERNGNHSIKDLVGVTLTDAVYEAGDKALYAEAKFFSNAATFISEAMEYIGLSIEASGTIHEGVIESISPSPLNAISVVPRAGRDGKITELLESYRERSGTIINEAVTNTADESGKVEGMNPEDLQKGVDGLKEALSPMLTAIQEALAPAKVEPKDEETVEVAVVAEAVVAASLPESARKRVYEAMKVEGADITTVIEAEKTYVNEIRESVTDTAATGFVREGATTDKPASAKVEGWV